MSVWLFGGGRGEGVGKTVMVDDGWDNIEQTWWQRDMEVIVD